MIVARKLLRPATDAEAVHLYARHASDLGDYMLFRGRRTGPESVSARPSFVGWLPNIEVEAGDTIVVKPGDARGHRWTTREDGGNILRVGLGTTGPVFSGAEDEVALLVAIRDFTFVGVAK